MKKILIDTDVMTAAFCSDQGKSRELLLMVLDGLLEAHCSVPLFMEYEAVLTRTNILKRARLTREEVCMVLDDLATVIKPVGLHFNWRPVANDPDDDLVIEAAVNGNIQTIVSFNIRDMKTGADQFGIEVMRPAQLLKRIHDG